MNLPKTSNTFLFQVPDLFVNQCIFYDEYKDHLTCDIMVFLCFVLLVPKQHVFTKHSS